MGNVAHAHEPPAVAHDALLDIGARKSIDGELRILENPGDPVHGAWSRLWGTDARRTHLCILPSSVSCISSPLRTGAPLQALEAVILPPDEITLNVEIRIAELGVCALAVGNSHSDHLEALGPRILVALRGVAHARWGGDEVRVELLVEALGEDGGDLARGLVVESGPKAGDERLRVVLIGSLSGRHDGSILEGYHISKRKLNEDTSLRQRFEKAKPKKGGAAYYMISGHSSKARRNTRIGEYPHETRMLDPSASTYIAENP